MLKYNFKYELKLLLRSRWIQLLSIVLLLLFGFSIFNGQQKVQKRKDDILAAQNEMKAKDASMLKLLDSVERGLEVSVPYWTIPNSPMAIGNSYPRVVAKPSKSMAFLSVGQADLFTHYVKPTVSGDDLALNFTEMTSPVQLLFGSFDLAFVIIYLLPLLIIAFSYNVLSSEKENGSLLLLSAQPISIRNWVFQKLILRFFWMSLLTVSGLIIMFLIANVNVAILGWTFLELIALIIAYMLFWFGLAFLVNLIGSNSAKNAVAMLGLWILFVLLIPSILNQLGTTLYPMPSRTLMINEMRNMKAEVAKKQDEILDNFLRDHPEYALNDTTQVRGFYHRYIASQKLVKEELKPVVHEYEKQLSKQQLWLSGFKWISPAILVQESLNEIAGTSTGDYEHFRKQVITFAEIWRAHLIPFLYNNKEFTQNDYDALPHFQFEHKAGKDSQAILLILMLSLTLFVLGGYVVGTSRKHSIMLKH